MLINLRVKTLDSQDHEFSVEDDITVRQFKERIQTKTGIEADLQRLIYCGRVMNDEHSLGHYDVNGKTVHLVQRPPPGSTPRTTTGNNTESTNSGPRRSNESNRNIPFFQVIDGAVLGAMAIPMNTNSNTTQALTYSMNPSSTLCMNRITVARHMLTCANNIANYLENPERGLNNTDMDILTQQTMESTVFEVGISAVSDSDAPHQDVQNLVQAFQGVVSAAFRQNGLSNIAIDAETGTAQATIPLVFGTGSTPSIELNTASVSNPPIRVFNVDQAPTTSSASNSEVPTSLAEPPAAAAAATATPPPPPPPAPESSTSHTQTHSTTESAGTSNETGDGSANNNQQTTSTQTLAEVVQQMRTVQARLEPFIQQYYDILLNEPVFDESDTAARESAQRVFDRVSEALHYFAHAQHAISDLMLDLSLDAPRHLCCRPILVEQSAFVSSGFAVPNIVPLVRRSETNANSNNNNNNSTANNNNTSAAESNTNSSTVQNETHPPASTESNTNATSSANNGFGPANAHSIRSVNAARQLQVARLIEAVVNSVPANADVHLEINQNPHGFEPHIEIQQTPQQQPTGTTITSTSTNGSPEQGAQENSQLRVTTATHPTTSTQTRSTARPQMHATGLPVGQIRNLRSVPMSPMQLSSFDRYLPCNSHHIRESEERQQRNQQIHIHRTPQVHIQRTNGSPARFTTFLNGRRSNNAAPATTQSTASQPQANNSSSTTLTQPGNLNDVELDTTIPIFGSNQVQLQIRDFVNVSPPPSTLNRIRRDLRDYITTTLSLAPTATEEDITTAVNQVITLVNQFLLLLPEVFNTPDYDARASIENLIRKTLPFILTLIRDDESNEFGIRLLREIIIFSKRFIVILLHSIGRPCAQNYIRNIIEAFFATITSATTDGNEQRATAPLQWLRRHIHTELTKRLQEMRLDSIDVIEFLVIRRPAPSAPVVQASTDTLMEVDANETENNDSMQSDVNEEPLEDPEPLPTITIGSESWHSNFPAPWLPIITRDISRQRRQSPQRPFSDAYLSGMSSKRRKLINGSKPSAVEPNTMLTQGIRQVLQTRVSRTGGTSSSSSSTAITNAVAPLEEAIASNQHIQEPYGSYEQAILNHVQTRINSDSDYTPERFPNCSKWLNKNK